MTMYHVLNRHYKTLVVISGYFSSITAYSCLHISFLSTYKHTHAHAHIYTYADQNKDLIDNNDNHHHHHSVTNNNNINGDMKCCTYKG